MMTSPLVQSLSAFVFTDLHVCVCTCCGCTCCGFLVPTAFVSFQRCSVHAHSILNGVRKGVESRDHEDCSECLI